MPCLLPRYRVGRWGWMITRVARGCICGR